MELINEKETKLRTGLVLEGGAMRGLFTCGVIDVLLEEQITFDGAIGVSAGAAFGCNFKSGQIGRALRYNKKYSKDKRYKSFRSFLKTGDYFGVDFCYTELPKVLDPWDTKAFRENPMEFYVVCTDARTGKPVYHRCTDGGERDIQYIRASASMPVVSRIVEVDGKQLLDGGISDSIPLTYLEEQGFRKNVVILTQPLNYVKSSNRLLPVVRLRHGLHPKVTDALSLRHLNYNANVAYITEREKRGELFVIRPSVPLNIKPTESRPEEMDRVYEIGRSVMRENLEALKKYLAM